MRKIFLRPDTTAISKFKGWYQDAVEASDTWLILTKMKEKYQLCSLAFVRKWCRMPTASITSNK